MKKYRTQHWRQKTSSIYKSYLALSIPNFKKKKKKHLKNSLYFQKRNFLALIIRKFLYTLKESLSFISDNGTIQFSVQVPKIKELHPRKIYYTSGNINSKKFVVLSRKERCPYISGNGTLPPKKKLLYFRKQSFHLFRKVYSER